MRRRRPGAETESRNYWCRDVGSTRAERHEIALKSIGYGKSRRSSSGNRAGGAVARRQARPHPRGTGDQAGGSRQRGRARDRDIPRSGLVHPEVHRRVASCRLAVVRCGSIACSRAHPAAKDADESHIATCRAYQPAETGSPLDLLGNFLRIIVPSLAGTLRSRVVSLPAGAARESLRGMLLLPAGARAFIPESALRPSPVPATARYHRGASRPAVHPVAR